VVLQITPVALAPGSAFKSSILVGERHHQEASWLLRITKTSTPVAAAPTSEPPNADSSLHVLPPSSAVPTDQSPDCVRQQATVLLPCETGSDRGYRDGKCNRIVHDAALERGFAVSVV